MPVIFVISALKFEYKPSLLIIVNIGQKSESFYQNYFKKVSQLCLMPKIELAQKYLRPIGAHRDCHKNPIRYLVE